MKFLTRIAVLFYVTLVLFIASFLILFVMGQLDLAFVQGMFTVIYEDKYLQYVFLGISALMLILNFVFYKLFSVNVHKEKIIAFDNPSGRITVSLFTLEDLIRKLVLAVPEIKDTKVNVIAARKGLQVKIKLVLNEDVNIPSLTSTIQSKITKKVQDMIGVDDPIDIAIYVGRIVTNTKKVKSVTSKEPEGENFKKGDEPNVPFHGYRR